MSARRTRVFVLAVLVTLAFLIFPSWNTWKSYRASEEYSTQELRLERLIGTIVHLDEVLTMSARMAAVTGDLRWEQRYRRAEPKLDTAIQEATQLSAGGYSAAAERTAAANRDLVAMEQRAFDLTREGRREEAQALLFSREYEHSKAAYAAGIEVLTAAIDARIQRDLLRSERQFLGAGALTLLSAGALVLAWVSVVGLIWRHLAARARAEKEREYLEAQLQHVQKLESLGVLAGGIAHDFNNLLMPILGNADLVLKGLPDDSPHRAPLLRLRDAAQRLSDLTHQMLAYSGKGAFVLRAIDLSGLVREVRELLEFSVSKKAEIEYDLAEDLPSIEGDGSQLTQVVMNLVTNASDALGDEPGKVAVRTDVVRADRVLLSKCYFAEDCSEGAYVQLDVSDSGCGMDAETRQRVFDPFYTTKFTGRGLGLAVILGIVRGHRGAICLDSEPGRGTTFRILFPCSERAVEPVARGGEPAGEWRASGSVLVVDDEPDVREVAGIMLRRFGFAVLDAADGRQAVEVFRKHADEIRAVLLDLTMPGTRGEEVLGEIRRVRPETPVVLMSGYSEAFATPRFSGRVARFLQKPFTREELGETLRSLLAG